MVTQLSKKQKKEGIPTNERKETNSQKFKK